MDDPRQASIAQAMLQNAELVALATPALCEFVWVLTKVYKKTTSDVISALQSLIACPNVVVNHATVAAGISVLAEGGDFADGAIAFEGELLGAKTFATFDRAAVKLIPNARLLK